MDKSRVQFIKIVFFLAMSLVVMRLAYWQIIKSGDLIAMAEDQRIFSKEVLAPRGEILYSDESTLASNQVAYVMFAQPKIIENKALFADKIAEVYGPTIYAQQWQEAQQQLETSDQQRLFEVQKTDQIKLLSANILDKISQDLFWVNLGNVDYETKLKLDKLNLYGLGFDQKFSRYYPEGSSSAHLLGFMSSDIYGAETGYFGLEGYYNGELKGKKGVLTQEKDANGLPILIGQYNLKDAQPGKTLVLNVDRTVQSIVEDKLKLGMQKYQPLSGSVVVMDPQTGAILAMASYPNYDPSHVMDFPKEAFRNPLTSDTYEPGSTFKVLVMAAAINEGLITPQTRCDICSGPLDIGGFTIRTWNNKYQENPTMTDVIVHSDNTGMVFTARKLGLNKLYNYIKSFGIGTNTNVDLQDDYSPDLRPLEDWKEIDLATASFGQGISTTGLQIARAVSIIANGGKLMEPHIVKEIREGDKVTKIEPRVVSQPITASTAAQVKQMMVAAVDEGESQFFKPKGYSIAGKTGTAQIPVAGHYDPNKTIASFVGFAPADNPKFLMLVRYNQPTSSIYGAETAAPTFFEIAKELFTYYGLPADQ